MRTHFFITGFSRVGLFVSNLAAWPVCLCVCVFAGTASLAQEGYFDARTGEALSQAAVDSLVSHPFQLFGPPEPIELDIISDFDHLIDHKADPSYQPAMLIHRLDSVAEVRKRIRIRPRGNTRREACYFPPLKLDFSRAEFLLPGLEHLDKMKLVTSCRAGQSYQEYVFTEFLAYRIFNQLTPLSFRVRLVRLRYVSNGSGAVLFSGYGFLIEDIDRLAARNGGNEIEPKKVKPDQTDPDQLTLVSVFQFLIGNFDWSVQGLHNVKLVQQEGEPGGPYAIPYDFDFSALVDAQYATRGEPESPPEGRGRIYQGPCRTPEQFEAIFTPFFQNKESIYGIVLAFPYLSDEEKKPLLDHLDSFYRTIEDSELARNYFIDNCRE